MKLQTCLILFLILIQACAVRPNKIRPRETANELNHFELVHKNTDFHSITQSMVRRFDMELDRLHKAKKSKKILNASDLEKLELQRTELQLAWEFSEKNLDALSDQYISILGDANNNDSPNQLKAQAALTELSASLDNKWVHGSKLSVISIAQHLSDANNDYQKTNSESQVIDFKKYMLNIDEMKKKSFVEISKKIIPKTETLQVFNEWSEYKNLRLVEIADQNDRNPQALDNLLPAADGRGTITGQRFPPGTWALTYDDGPHPTQTREMYKVLKSNSVPATFFWLTKNILLYPDIAKEAPALGHSLASHSYNHPQLPKLSPQNLEREVSQAANDFSKIIGQRPTLFRCPYGDCGGNNSAVRQLIAKNNMIHVGWNVDTLDWQDKNPASIFERTKKQMDILGRGIILFHDIHTQSVEATKLLLPYMKNVKKVDIKPLKEIISIVRERPFESP